MNIEHETVARWFNYVRENTLNIKRFTECFWDTQLKSKAEIIDNLPQDLHGNYYVFGGWYGVLAHLLNDNICLLYTSPSPRDRQKSRMPSSA